MKASILIYFLFLSFGLYAQNKTFSVDTTKDKYLITSDYKSSVVYVIDGVPSSNEQIAICNIIEKRVLTGKQLAELYVEKKLDSVILITTKHGAYKLKLSLISRKYRGYLKAHKNSDDWVLYILNGTPLESGECSTVNALFDIPKNNIKSVKFVPRTTKKGVYVNSGDRAALIIQTKT